MTSLAHDHFAPAAERADHARVDEVPPARRAAPIGGVSTAVACTHCGDVPTPTRRRTSHSSGRVCPAVDASRHCRGSALSRGGAADTQARPISPAPLTTPGRSRLVGSRPLQRPPSRVGPVPAAAAIAGHSSTARFGDACRAAVCLVHPHLVRTMPHPYETLSEAREVVSQSIR